MRSNITILLTLLLPVGAATLSLGAPKSAALRAEGVVVSLNAVTISTSDDGMWTYITVPSKTADGGLQAAFVAQFGAPTSTAVSFQGQAKLIFAGSLLIVSPDEGGGWIFKLRDCCEEMPSLRSRPGAVVILKGARADSEFAAANLTRIDALGLAHYWWNSVGLESTPASHAEFVSQHQKLAAEWTKCVGDAMPLELPACPKSCGSGGEGATECSLNGDNGCSVKCSVGTACCNYMPAGCHCCQ